MMANVRTCMCLLLLVISYKFVTAEPTFGSRIWCNLFCEDGDDDSDDDSYDYDLFDIFDVCAGCPSSSSGGSTTKAPNTQKPVAIMIPPASGLNLTVSSGSGGSVLMNLMPWAAVVPPKAPAAAGSAGSGGPAPPITTTAAPATTTAGSTKSTTAAATTKKP